MVVHLPSKTVKSFKELNDALADGANVIQVVGTLQRMHSLTLPPGVGLRGGELVSGAKLQRLTRDNTLENLTLRASAHEQAIYNDSSLTELGTVALLNLTIHGQAYLCAEDNIRVVVQKPMAPPNYHRRPARMQRPTGF